jgi:ABC-2 type transport system permease protein
MNTPSNALPGPSLATAAHPARPFYWSVRRELWENRSLYLVPLIAAGVALIGFLWASRHLPEKIRDAAALDPNVRHALLTASHDYVAALLIVVTTFTGVFYCLDALHGERRDRSILFWKSLPVSDVTTVLSKAFIPLVALPVIAFAVILATQLLMLLIGTLIVMSSGESPALLWAQASVFRNPWVLVYGLITLALWYAPLYGWLFVVSAWAQRAPILWAVLPPFVLAIIEKITFNTTYVAALLRSRLAGGFSHAFIVRTKESGAALGDGGGHGAERMAQAFSAIPDPAKFVSSPAVWIGVVVAVAFFALAVWLRRRRDPI